LLRRVVRILKTGVPAEYDSNIIKIDVFIGRVVVEVEPHFKAGG